jgi:serine/threonine protein phosphatase PrpC
MRNKKIGYKLASSYIVGKGHITKNIPCQDRTAKLVRKKNGITFYGLALADGAGSYKYSDIGAEYIISKVLNFIHLRFTKLFKKDDLNKVITAYIEKELETLSYQRNTPFKEFSSTLLFIAIKKDKFIIGHIGDGVIGMLDKNNNMKTISKPDNGEFSNSTYFTTSIKYTDRLRILKGTLKNATGFILMSDGTEESLYNKKDEILVDSNKIIINWLKENSEKDVEKALYSNLEQVISHKTSDDCSIGIIRVNS